jgi:site-specific recombinase XerD
LLPKALRYASGSHCLENGMDLYALHQMMGHEYVDTTESIQKLAVGRWRTGYDQCHPLCGQRVMGGSEQSHLSVSEIFQMLEAAKTVGKASDRERNYLILRLLYASGMRVSELANLVYGDVFYREGRLFVRQGKGSKDRYVLIDRETGELLREFQGEQPLEAPIMDIEVRQIANVIKKVGKETGILAKYESQGYSLSPHSFRHAYATHLYRNHMDSFALEKLMGHVDLETTFADYVSCDLAFWQAAYTRHHELSATHQS